MADIKNIQAKTAEVGLASLRENNTGTIAVCQLKHRPWLGASAGGGVRKPCVGGR